jgi:Asp/Glu/hydantoin racemase
MPDKTENRTLRPFMGIIMLDTHFPRIRGDIGNPASFGFPVHYKVVKGASTERMVIRADKTLIRPFIEAGRSLIRDGAIALATSCGFLALFHRELTLALDVPVFSSSLLQVHLAQTLLKPGQKVGVITARKPSLTIEHLAAVGIQNIPMIIQGMEGATEFTNVFIKGKPTLNESLCRKEMKTVAQNLVTRHPDVGPIVLECTNMPPYTDVIQQITGQPVFDIITLLNMAWAALNPIIR